MNGVKNGNLDLIKERLNILDVISTYIKLDKAGSQFRARCPFHNEKSPSFYVSPAKGFYHCFGCSEHGDIFGFVMKIEGLNFKDALRLLADRAGVSLSNFKKEETSSLVDILEITTLFFEKNLSQTLEAKKYLESRGVSIESIQKFRIGYAPNDWRQLYHTLKQKGFSDEEIVTSGVCIKHEKGLYDRFRNRIMFPIMNASGKVVAFTGRILPQPLPTSPINRGGEIREEAKYVNSPETPMYHKSSILFGYNFAKQEIAKLKKVLVVEGQMDVVMAHQAGDMNAVAISGTAFTPEHISILKRFAETVVLALDTDKAGYAAMLKSAALALENDLEVEGLKLTDKDPADMIKTNVATWKSVVENTKPILTLIAEIIEEKEKIKPKQIQRMRKELFPLLRSVRSPLLKESFVKEISKFLDIDEAIIRQETENQAGEIEKELASKRKTEKVKVKKDILLFAAKIKAALEILKEKGRTEFFEPFNNEFDNLKKLDLSTNLDEIPEVILQKEHILLEQSVVEDEEQNIKNLVDFIKFSLKNIYEEAISIYKSKIKNEEKNDESGHENLKIIQNLTKALTRF